MRGAIDPDAHLRHQSQDLFFRFDHANEINETFITALLKRFPWRTNIIANVLSEIGDEPFASSRSLYQPLRSHLVIQSRRVQRLYLSCASFRKVLCIMMSSSSHQSPFGRSRQQPRMNSPLFSTSDDNTAISNISSKSSTISGGAEGSNSCIGSTSSKKPAAKTIEDKIQKDITNRALSKKAQMENDAMVYLDGPQIYTCGQCRTHLTSHDDIISKSFHGRHGMLCACDVISDLILFCLYSCCKC